MRKGLIMIALCVGMIACKNGDTVNKAKAEVRPLQDVVEVLYFHTKQRCATCIAIEKHTTALLETTFAEQLASGELVFRSVDISDNETLADKYEVSWSSLIVVDHDKEGGEHVKNMTEFAFANARKSTDNFMTQLSSTITQMLND